MLKKTILILIAGFIFQSLISCYDNCNSAPGQVDMIYTSMDIETGVKTDDDINPIQDSIRKENFHLLVSFVEIEEEQANSKVIIKFGFNTLQAEDCIPDYLYINTVQSLNISMINQQDTNQVIDVTELFEIKTVNETYTIEELIDLQSAPDAGGNYFNLSLLEYDSIYQNASFRVTATLESGETFTEETQEIKFVD